jgi:hypothetical protein
MRKRNRRKKQIEPQQLFDPDIAARYAEILHLREQIKKAIAKRKKRRRLLS